METLACILNEAARFWARVRGDDAGVCRDGRGDCPFSAAKTLHDVTGRTFNAISVDGDTSTNDTLLVLATAKQARLRSKRGRPRIEPSLPRLKKFAARSRCKSSLTAKARSAHRNRSAQREE